MISKEELIKHKWKYIPESHSWIKLGVTFRDVDRALNHYTLRFTNTLRSGIHISTLSDLEHYIKGCVSIIF